MSGPPYVEMVPPPTGDDTFLQAWYCRETAHSLGLLNDVTGGCGGSDLDMFPGWTVPEATAIAGGTLSENVLRAEIMEHVIDPCYLEVASRNPVNRVSPEQFVELAKAMNPASIEQAILSLLPLVSDAPDFETRALFYTFGKQACLEGMEGQSGAAPAAVSVQTEPGAVLGPRIVKLDNQQDVFDELTGLIHAKGWACDSLSAVHTLTFSRGFKVRCNYYAYQYRIEDRGGRWEVTLD